MKNISEFLADFHLCCRYTCCSICHSPETRYSTLMSNLTNLKGSWWIFLLLEVLRDGIRPFMKKLFVDFLLSLAVYFVKPVPFYCVVLSGLLWPIRCLFLSMVSWCLLLGQENTRKLLLDVRSFWVMGNSDV